MGLQSASSRLANRCVELLDPVFQATTIDPSWATEIAGSESGPAMPASTCTGSVTGKPSIEYDLTHTCFGENEFQVMKNPPFGFSAILGTSAEPKSGVLTTVSPPNGVPAESYRR